MRKRWQKCNVRLNFLVKSKHACRQAKSLPMMVHWCIKKITVQIIDIIRTICRSCGLKLIMFSFNFASWELKRLSGVMRTHFVLPCYVYFTLKTTVAIKIFFNALLKERSLLHLWDLRVNLQHIYLFIFKFEISAENQLLIVFISLKKSFSVLAKGCQM